MSQDLSTVSSLIGQFLDIRDATSLSAVTRDCVINMAGTKPKRSDHCTECLQRLKERLGWQQCVPCGFEVTWEYMECPDDHAGEHSVSYTQNTMEADRNMRQHDCTMDTSSRLTEIYHNYSR